MTEARDKRRGIPQGSPLSPLLANIYMRRFVLGWKMFGLERSLGTRLITYADDLVILCGRGKAEAALQADGERGEDTDLQSAGRRVRLSGIHVRANVFGEDRPSPYRLPAVKEKHSARGLLHRRLQPFRHLHDCSGCFRLERLPGGACTHWKAPPSHGAHVMRTLRIRPRTSQWREQRG